jgi:hypothetical protein
LLELHEETTALDKIERLTNGLIEAMTSLKELGKSEKRTKDKIEITWKKLILTLRRADNLFLSRVVQALRVRSLSALFAFFGAGKSLSRNIK